jgi:hypothetical protein
MLTPAECRLAAALLNLAADEFSNHGCNDFRLRSDGGLDDEEARVVVADLNASMHPLDAARPDADCLQDSMLMRHLAKKLDRG